MPTAWRDVAERDTAGDRGCYLAVAPDSTLRVGTARERLCSSTYGRTG